jgi:cytochrome c biogenesis protein CcmG, thiol:disulfide interchange protein DsbE
MSNRPSSTKRGHRHTASSSARVAQARQASDSSRVWFIVVGVVVAVVLIALAVAIGMSRSNDTAGVGVASAGFDLSPDAPDDLVFGEVNVDGAALPGADDAMADPAIGQPAPALTGQRFDGEPITIGGADRPMLVMFMAHWCPHCQQEVPRVTAHLDGTLPTDVDLRAVSTSANRQQPNYPPGDWLRRESWPVPTLVDDAEGSAATAYGLRNLPYFVAVNADGQVVARTSGQLTTDQFDALVGAARGT